jgi:hypothetical protein
MAIPWEGNKQEPSPMGARKVISRRLKPHNDLGLAREVQRGCRLGAILLEQKKSLIRPDQNQAEEEEGGTRNSPWRWQRDRASEEAAEEARRGEPAASSASGGEEGKGTAAGERVSVRFVFGSLEDIILFIIRGGSEVGRDGRPRSMRGRRQRKSRRFRLASRGWFGSCHVRMRVRDGVLCSVRVERRQLCAIDRAMIFLDYDHINIENINNVIKPSTTESM